MMVSISDVIRSVEKVLVQLEEKSYREDARHTQDGLSVYAKRHRDGPDEGNRRDRKYIKIEIEVGE